MKLKNSDITLVFKEDGTVEEIISPLGKYNLADKNGFGRFCYTKINEDVRCDEEWIPYKNYSSSYDRVSSSGVSVECINNSLDVKTTYSLKKESILISTQTNNPEFSEFGFEVNFNFYSKKADGIIGQLLPSSPYTSYDGKRMYCIMPIIGVGFCAVLSKGECCAWKTDYYINQHITNFKFLASVDKLYSAETNEKRILEFEIIFAKTIEECYEKISKVYDCPMVYSQITGTFGKGLYVDIFGAADYLDIYLSDMKKMSLKTKGQKKIYIPLDEYGIYHIVPYGKTKGLDTAIWSGKNVKSLYKKSCDTIKKPYHGDYNACEGMVWCWSLLRYMNFYKNEEYIKQAFDGVDIIMGKNNCEIDHATILSYEYNGNPAYHIKNSKRIQEQFFAVSILTEAYKLTKNKGYLDYAVNSLECMIETYQNEEGALMTPRGDYTTVCSPIIAVVDLALLLREIDKDKAEYFEKKAEMIADYLVKRDMNFPTECGCEGVYDSGYEDGSISCTALSVLYYCYYINKNEKYIEFAKKILDFHDWWITYTPDSRLYRSTMRWWETIWEGDALGHGICGGHAWTIWRAEADFYYGILAKSGKHLKNSWNGFVTNFSKIQSNGTTYACYQPDYITCGGSDEIRKNLLTLKGEDIGKKYRLVHGYFEHNDNSLSRYVWARVCDTWLKTAVIIKDGENTKCINCEFEDMQIKTGENIENIFFVEE